MCIIHTYIHSLAYLAHVLSRMAYLVLLIAFNSLRTNFGISISYHFRGDSNILSCIPTANIFIEAGVENGGTLVHCFGGLNTAVHSYTIHRLVPHIIHAYIYCAECRTSELLLVVTHENNRTRTRI